MSKYELVVQRQAFGTEPALSSFLKFANMNNIQYTLHTEVIRA